jgi:two-component system, OmpR family, KDP operon response regulator KdpE
VIAGLRGWTDVPILVLSAREQSREKVAALDAGADDYVVKPFGMDELLARLRAAIRRGASEPANPRIETDDFTIDLSAGRVTADGEDVKLTPTEWHLLEVLARNPGKVVDHGRLLTEVWGPAYREQTNYLRVYMATLRRKLEPDAANPRHLLTDAGRGYRFEP